MPPNCLSDAEFGFAAAKFQLLGFCDASNLAFFCVIYRRCFVNNIPSVSFILRKSRVVLKQQANWIILGKELLMLQAKNLCVILLFFYIFGRNPEWF